MAEAILSIKVVDCRMIKRSEAARYCGLSEAAFKDSCPVQPIEIRPGMQLWDKRDLDLWIDSLKEGGDLMTHESILGRLE